MVIEADMESDSSVTLTQPDKNAQEQDNLSLETVFSEIHSIHEMLNQPLPMQKESQKQVATLVAGPIIKEDKWLEATIALAVDNAFKANSDALWASFKEETIKNEKLMKESMHKIKKMTTGLVNKQLQSMVEKTVKEVTHTITTTLEEILSSSLMEAFQAGFVDKMENQLEKSVNAKLKATAARQIQAQFPTSGKQPLEEEDVPEIDQEVSRLAAVNLDWHHRSDYDSDSQEHDEGGSLDESENGDENDTKKEDDSVVELNDEDEDAMFLVASKAAIKRAMKVFEMGKISQASAPSSSSRSPFGPSDSLNEQDVQLNNLSLETKTKEMLLDLLFHKGPQSGFHEKVEAPLDPTRELSKLIAEHKYEEAFTASKRTVSWLCSQVELQKLLSATPMPLSRGVLLYLLQQLACDIHADMTDVALAITPANDPMNAIRVRPVFEQVYQILSHHLTLPTVSAAEVKSIRILMQVINSIRSNQ